MTSRLHSIAPDLAAKLESQSESGRNGAVLAACEAAGRVLACTSLQLQALAALRNGTPVAEGVAKRLAVEVETLDDAYFAGAARDPAGGVQEFFMARMGAALQFALGDGQDSAAEAVYEASMASDDQTVVLEAVRRVLAA